MVSHLQVSLEDKTASERKLKESLRIKENELFMIHEKHEQEIKQMRDLVSALQQENKEVNKIK